MSKNIAITIVQDNKTINKTYIDLLKQHYSVRLVDIDAILPESFIDSDLMIIQINLNDPNAIAPLKVLMALPERSHIPALFLLREFSRREIIQASTLGATDYTTYPCPEDSFLQLVYNMINKSGKKIWAQLSETQEEALKVSLKVVENTFRNASLGLEVSQKDVKDSCNLIIEATAKDGLTEWMNTIRQHHVYTYRHSMMVCGYLLSFGMLLGLSKTDLQMLAVGGMIHDIGKAKVPLEILDKSTALTPKEIDIIKKHPEDGRHILEKQNWDKVMIDIAAHHHEKLDGTGYPSGLKGVEISDTVRIASIANVFSGLTDKRPNKPAMTAEKAIERMLKMKDHLDFPLVLSFRDVVLPSKINIEQHMRYQS